MPAVKLIAESGSTKTSWCLSMPDANRIFNTQGISPYFLNSGQMQHILMKEVRPKIKEIQLDEIYYYGTGCGNPDNVKLVKNALKKVFPGAAIKVDHDLTAAAKATCGDQTGIACILGTGSNSGFYNGKKIVKMRPGLGYILGDEGSGAYLGKKVIRHFLYDIFDKDLRARFEAKFDTDRIAILNAVYTEPLPNRYLASFAIFLAENRGHYMIENIIEDGLSDFFINHITRYDESRKYPLHFVGGIAFGFKDVLENICNDYQLQLGRILKDSLEGLITYHSIGSSDGKS